MNLFVKNSWSMESATTSILACNSGITLVEWFLRDVKGFL
jgi:hypothetical protein